MANKRKTLGRALFEHRLQTATPADLVELLQLEREDEMGDVVSEFLAKIYVFIKDPTFIDQFVDLLIDANTHDNDMTVLHIAQYAPFTPLYAGAALERLKNIKEDGQFVIEAELFLIDPERAETMTENENWDWLRTRYAKYPVIDDIIERYQSFTDH